VALAPETVHVLGALTSLDIPVSGFRLHPIVGASEERPVLAPADDEVARILEVRVADLCDRSRRSSIAIARDGQHVVAPAFRIGGVDIWGATAMVLAEFLVVAGWVPDK